MANPEAVLRAIPGLARHPVLPCPSWVLLAYVAPVRTSVGLRNLDISGVWYLGLWTGIEAVEAGAPCDSEGPCSVLDDKYLKVEVPGVHAHGHVYLYFLTLTWRAWESHPLSAIGSLRREEGRERVAIVSKDLKCEHLSKDGPSVTTVLESDKRPSSASTPSSQDLTSDGYYRPCLTLFVRTQSGITRCLRAKSQLPALVGGCYHPSPQTSERWSNHPPSLAELASPPWCRICAATEEYISLLWACRSRALIESVQETLGNTCSRDLNMRIYNDQPNGYSKTVDGRASEVSWCAGLCCCQRAGKDGG